MAGGNSTVTAFIKDYDYFYYYSNTSTPTPCETEFLTDFGKLFLPILYSLVFILGFIGNGLVVCVLMKQCHKNLTDLCLFNLALSDLLFLLTLPFYAHYTAVNEWVFGDFMCHVTSGFHNTGFYSSIFFMVVMTLDRYVLIMHAHTIAKYRTIENGIALSFCVWVLSLFTSLPAFVFTQYASDRESCEYAPENDIWFYYNAIATNILGLVIPFSVMVVCYSMIIPTLMKIRSTKKHRIVKLIIAIMIVFFLFWAPYNITLFLDFLRQIDQLNDNCELDTNLRLSTTVTEPIAFSHCCLNPIIYAFVGEKFMKRSLLMLRKLLPWIPFPSGRDFSENSIRMSSGISRNSVTSTVIM